MTVDAHCYGHPAIFLGSLIDIKFGVSAHGRCILYKLSEAVFLTFNILCTLTIELLYKTPRDL